MSHGIEPTAITPFIASTCRTTPLVISAAADAVTIYNGRVTRFAIVAVAALAAFPALLAADAPVGVPGAGFVVAPFAPGVLAAFCDEVPELLGLAAFELVLPEAEDDELALPLLEPDPEPLGAVGADVGVIPGT